MRSLAFVVVLFAACGGSSADSTAKAPAADPAPAPAPTADDKLRAAQDHAIEAMCDRLVDCAIDDAKAANDPEVGDPEELRPKALARCNADYGQSSLSPRQIKTIQGCVNEARECPALDTCLESVNKAP
jgi:hypothetical protein